MSSPWIKPPPLEIWWVSSCHFERCIAEVKAKISLEISNIKSSLTFTQGELNDMKMDWRRWPQTYANSIDQIEWIKLKTEAEGRTYRLMGSVKGLVKTGKILRNSAMIFFSEPAWPSQLRQSLRTELWKFKAHGVPAYLSHDRIKIQRMEGADGGAQHMGISAWKVNPSTSGTPGVPHHAARTEPSPDDNTFASLSIQDTEEATAQVPVAVTTARTSPTPGPWHSLIRWDPGQGNLIITTMPHPWQKSRWLLIIVETTHCVSSNCYYRLCVNLAHNLSFHRCDVLPEFFFW